MTDPEQLAKQKKEWDELIARTERNRNQVVDVLVTIREEIASLNALYKNYPNSKEIPVALAQKNNELTNANKILEDIDAHLPRYSEQRDEVIKLMARLTEFNQESSARGSGSFAR